MKKLLALLMALMMCCTAFAFAEEEAEVPAVEMNVSFEAQTVALGDTGLTMQIPADWAVQEVPAGTENAENVLLFAVNADQTVSITVQKSAMTFDALLQGIQDAGATEEMLAELYVNENYCLMYTPGDTVLALYAFLDDETVLAVTFQVPARKWATRWKICRWRSSAAWRQRSNSLRYHDAGRMSVLHFLCAKMHKELQKTRQMQQHSRKYSKYTRKT